MGTSSVFASLLTKMAAGADNGSGDATVVVYLPGWDMRLYTNGCPEASTNDLVRKIMNIPNNKI